MKEVLTDAIGYWEPRRILYNAALLVVVVAVFLVHLPASRYSLNLNFAQMLFIQAVLANVAYCAAYLVDIVAQLSGFQSTWKRFRWILLVVGLVFAVILARFFAEATFALASGSTKLP